MNPNKCLSRDLMQIRIVEGFYSKVEQNGNEIYKISVGCLKITCQL